MHSISIGRGEVYMNHTVKLNKPIKNVLIIGDSYSTFKGYIPKDYGPYYTGEWGTDLTKVEETWWHRFVARTGANLVLNDSWSGSTVCYTGRVSPEFAYRSSFIHRMHLMIKDGFFEREKIDTVLIFGATNDSWLETTPKGEIQLSDWTEEDLYSTLPAIGYMIAKLKEILPDGNIIYMINTELLPCINEAVKVASDHFGTSYLEFDYIDKTDGHPTVKGMADICDQLMEAIG